MGSAMTLVHESERDVVRAVAALVECNPFLPERVALERRALGRAFVPAAVVWHADVDMAALNPNAGPLRQLVEGLGTQLRQRLAAGASATPAEMADYFGVVLYLLLIRYEDDWYALIESAPARSKRVSCYGRFARDVAYFFGVVPAAGTVEPVGPAHLFALGYQARRAFHYIFRQIYGGSLPAARLRATVWESIFTRNVRRYRAMLRERMWDIPTLISGESGTGKELVARAIALSRYVPFDARTQTFIADPTPGFCAVNLSALSPTLIESELFGHRRGAFTGAAEDRRGWLEACGPYGTVFLDEIGELDAAIQVKLLRVMQTRDLQRIGETTPRHFEGKVIAATNRDLGREISAGRFREDLYYRLCADSITMPTLREQLADMPGDLRNLLHVAAGRVIAAAGVEALAAEVERWVEKHLGPDYPWPGNMRELEQCVRSILVRSEYWPRRRPFDEMAEVLRDGELTADEMLQRYCATVYAQSGSYQETARRLRLDRRTVRTKVGAWTRRARNGAPA
jgi:transcriptional regulator with AAA-type ATPase domain